MTTHTPRMPLALVFAARPPAKPAARRAGRARAALVFGAVLFLLAQAGLNLAVRREWVPFRDPVYFEKFDLLKQNPAFFDPSPAAPVRVLALGSSRTQLAFDAGTLADTLSQKTGRPVAAFNFGVPAAGPMTNALYLRRLLAAGVRCDRVLVELHPCFASPVPFEPQWLLGYRIRPDEIAHLARFGFAAPPAPHHGWRGWAAAAHVYRMPVLNKYLPKLLATPYGLSMNQPTDRFGFTRGEFDPAARAKLLRRTWESYRPVLDGFRIGGPGVEAVRDTFAVCRDHDIRAALVLLPENVDFRGWYGEAGRAEIAAFTAELAAEFGVPVFDAREWVPEGGFADGHHLVATGAAAYTANLAEAVERWMTETP